MRAPARPAPRHRSGSPLVALFAATILLPGLLLAGLAARTFVQEREFARQQLRDQLDRAAHDAARGLERELRAWQAALDRAAGEEPGTAGWPRLISEGLSTPGAAVVVRPGADAPFWPAGQVPFTSEVPPVQPPGPTHPALAEAEASELQERDLARAARLYRRLERHGPASLRATATQRLARTLRKMGRETEALAAYRELVAVPGSIGSLPAALLARHEICVLESRGTPPSGRACVELHRDLVQGRWPLDRARYLHYVESARLHGATDRDAASALEPLTQLDARARALGDAALALRRAPPGDSATASGAAAVIPGRSPQAGALVISRAWLGSAVWARVFEPTLRAGLEVRLTAGNREPWFESGWGAADAHTGPHRLVATAAPHDGWVPWRVSVTPRDPSAFAAEAARRQRGYLLMLALTTALLASGTYLTLRVLRRELEMARQQSDFVSTVSHEFRSPLTGIRQLAEMLARGRVPSEERRQEYYERITRESERLARLVENVLDFSRMEDGRKQYRFEPLDTADWLRGVVREAGALEYANGHRIVASVPDRLPAVRADRDALSSAVHNLLDNAAKYSPGRDAVWVQADASAGEVTIRVRDEGVGISREDRPHVFERFYRAQSEITRQVKGAGLGLSLVAHIVRAHGGSVECDSQPGQGTTFTIRLRAAADGPSGS